jgi:uncharacterized repeat protein (TIGR02543 family)
MSDIIFKNTEQINAPTNPTKEGHAFSGWFIDEDFSESFDFDKKLSKDTILYAKWEINHYLIDYYIFEDYNPLDTVNFNESDKIIRITLGARFSVTLTSNSRVYTWGENSSGQLGNGTNVSQSYPLDISSNFNLEDDEEIIDITSGGWHVLAMTSKGRVFTWGNNGVGQLGDGTTIDKSLPLDITNQFNLDNNDHIVSISSGNFISSAISSTGRIFMWGDNGYGQLGDGTTVDKLIPTDITSQFDLPSTEKIIYTSLGERHASALTSTGRVFVWGTGSYGQLGDGLTGVRTVPFDITSQFDLVSNESIVSISLGAIHSSAHTSTGRYFIWGNNFLGRLGDGALDNRSIPFDISNLFNLEEHETIARISLGSFNSSAVTSLNKIFIWGGNEAGQIGNGETVDKNVRIDITSQFDLEDNESIILVELGYWHTSVLTSLGRVFIWGNNASGQLGDGTLTSQLTQIELEKIVIHEQEAYDYHSVIDEYKPVRDGYTFSGWFMDNTFTDAYELSTMPAENVDLFGYWIPNS